MESSITRFLSGDLLMATATITASPLSYMNAQWEDLADTPLLF